MDNPQITEREFQPRGLVVELLDAAGLALVLRAATTIPIKVPLQMAGGNDLFLGLRPVCRRRIDEPVRRRLRPRLRPASQACGISSSFSSAFAFASSSLAVVRSEARAPTASWNIARTSSGYVESSVLRYSRPMMQVVPVAS